MNDLEKASKIILDMFKDDPTTFNIAVFLTDYLYSQPPGSNSVNMKDYAIESVYQIIPTPRSKKSLYKWRKIPFILDKRTRSVQTNIKLHPNTTDEMIKIIFEHIKNITINYKCLMLMYKHNIIRPVFYSWT